MKFKLTRTQIEGLYTFLGVALRNDTKNILMLLLNELVHDIAEKVRKKSIKMGREFKPHTSITLNPIEAKALYVWFNTLCKNDELPDLYYEITVMKMLSDHIQHEYV